VRWVVDGLFWLRGMFGEEGRGRSSDEVDVEKRRGWGNVVVLWIGISIGYGYLSA
jgi:hypothetical protein